MHLRNPALGRALALGIVVVSALLAGCAPADPSSSLAQTPTARAATTANDPAPSPVPVARVSTATFTPLPVPTATQPAAGSPTKDLPVGPEPGSLAPDITLIGMDGSEVRVSDFRGKRVLLNFWTTW